jgi:hypothetical protein
MTDVERELKIARMLNNGELWIFGRFMV